MPCVEAFGHSRAGPGIRLSDGSISVANLGIAGPLEAVTGAEVVDRSISTADIALGAVTGFEVASYAVGST